jgi:hypothetical protein
VGFVMVNASESFRSPDMNKFDLAKTPATSIIVVSRLMRSV